LSRSKECVRKSRSGLAAFPLVVGGAIWGPKGTVWEWSFRPVQLHLCTSRITRRSGQGGVRLGFRAVWRSGECLTSSACRFSSATCGGSGQLGLQRVIVQAA